MEMIMSTNINDIVVSEVMLNTNYFPIVGITELVRETLTEMSKFKLGIACVVDKNNKLLAVITDGDFRRILLASQKPLASLFVEDVLDYASTNFKSVQPNTQLKEAIELMGNNKVWDLPVIDNKGYLSGMLHLHPALETVMKYKRID